MEFTYRLKYYKDEDGEYTDYTPGDKVIIQHLIDTHWQVDHPSKVLEIISISNESAQSLLLEHYDRYVFDVYYLGSDTDYHFHKRSTLDVVCESVDLFFSNRLDELEASLNQTKKENDYIRGDYFYKDHTYRITSERTFKEFLFAFIGFLRGIPPVFLGFFLLSVMAKGHSKFVWAPYVIISMAVVLIFMGLLISLFGLFLHFQYFKENRNLSVRVTKGTDAIIIQTPLGTTTRYKNDVVKVTHYRNPRIRVPWSNYQYVQIEFKSGEVLNMTNLMVNPWSMENKFSNDIKVNIVNGNVRLPINKKTYIKL